MIEMNDCILRCVKFSLPRWILLLCLLCGCNPIYVVKVGSRHLNILYQKRDIPSVLKDDELKPVTRRALSLALEVRSFANKSGLEVDGAYSEYVDLEVDYLSWIVLGSKKDKFELKTWWFPFVGSVPYKGYFERETALELAAELEDEGYETWTRPTTAYSTLGWFDDPILSTMIRGDEVHLVNTLLHELFHRTFWVKGSVDFNESLANFVGNVLTVEFYREKVSRCTIPCIEEEKLKLAERVMSRDLLLSDLLTSLYEVLNTLYESKRSREEKLLERDALFFEHTLELHERFPEFHALKTVNNAEIMQLFLYVKEQKLFHSLYVQEGAQWERFLTLLHMRSSAFKDDKKNPFDELRKLLADN